METDIDILDINVQKTINITGQNNKYKMMNNDKMEVIIILVMVMMLIHDICIMNNYYIFVVD